MNISLSELLVILLVALLVLKPEQLPEVAQSVGKFAKSIKKIFSTVKSEVNGLIEAIDNNEQQNKK